MQSAYQMVAINSQFAGSPFLVFAQEVRQAWFVRLDGLKKRTWPSCEWDRDRRRSTQYVSVHLLASEQLSRESS